MEDDKVPRTADLVEGVHSALRGRPGAIVAHLCAQAGGGGEAGLDAPKVLSDVANHGFFSFTFFDFFTNLLTCRSPCSLTRRACR